MREGNRALLSAIGLVVVLVVAGSYYRINFQGLDEIESFNYAQLARHLSRGEGFTTSFLLPTALLFDETLTSPPDIINPPLYPAVLSLFFRLFGSTEAVSALCSMVFFVLTVLGTARLAGRLFGRRVALLAAFLYLTNVMALKYSVSGLPVTLSSFLLVLLFLILLRLEDPHEGRPGLLAPAAGGVLGLLYLTDYGTFPYLLPVAALLVLNRGLGRERWKCLLLLALGFVVVSLPWWIRNYRVAGSPFFSLCAYEYKIGTAAFPSNAVFRLFDGDLLNRPIAPAALLDKMRRNFFELYLAMLALSRSFIMPLFLADVLRTRRGTADAPMRAALYLLIGVALVTLTITYPDQRKLFHFLPLIFILGSAFFFHLLDQVPWRSKGACTAVVCAFVLLNLSVTLNELHPGASQMNRATRSNLESLSLMVDPGDVIVTDAPWLVSWYADRKALWLTWTYEGFLALKARFSEVRHAYFTPALLQYPSTMGIHLWKIGYQSCTPPEGSGLTKCLRLPGREVFFSAGEDGAAQEPSGQPFEDGPPEGGLSQGGPR